MLQATDIHFENLVAFGQFPVVVDTETLFQPRLLSEQQKRFHPDLNLTLADSMTRVGLLPHPGKKRKDDKSGLGAPLNQSLASGPSNPLLKPLTCHRPSINGVPIVLSEYCRIFSKQFAETYRVVMASKRELASSDLLLTPFVNSETRIVVRPSAEYARVLRAKTYKQQVVLLTQMKDSVTNRQFLKPLVEDEIQQLHEFDIPYFRASPDSTDITSSTGRVFRNFLATPGLETAGQRISQMSESDLQVNLKAIEQSFG